MERFWSKVQKTETCWLWTSRTRAGYGRFRLAGKSLSAHRFAYELLVGPIPEGLQLDHLCRNHACVNPAHLEPVTAQVNILRGAGLAAISAAKTHCNYGHEFTPENTLTWPCKPNSRYCRECNRRRTREYQRSRRAARRDSARQTECAPSGS